MKSALLSLIATALLAAPGGDPAEVSFAVLSNFEFKEGMKLPDFVTKYDGKKIKVSGFMSSEDGSTGDVEYFVLVNDACGCEGTPKLNEMIFCAMPEGTRTAIQPGTVTVTGTLYASEEKEEGVVVTLYTMSVDAVQ